MECWFYSSEIRVAQLLKSIGTRRLLGELPFQRLFLPSSACP